MNAVEIEQAITDLADQSFDPAEFPFAFLECFDNSPARAKRLRKKQTNKSDIGGVLQVNNIHIKVADHGHVSDTLRELRESPATRNKRNRVKFILSTDGQSLEAEDLNSGETVACSYEEFPDKFGFFLPLAGITTVKQIRENTFDVRATSRLNKLYMTLLQENPDWGTEDRRHDLNHFMARLIFCFFAEDTDIFNGDDLFTATISRMSERDSSNTHEVISEIFRAMDVKIAERANANLPRWADVFPYVNGELFSGSTEVPKFSRIAKKYLLHIGNLDWKQINPDIFGSMIQAVADEEERSALGMHYTSVPNILKVLNPLFLDDLRDKLAEAGHNPRKLLNLRKRMSNIRVFDPACGSGNFLVIAYKEMRAIEAEINERRGEKGQKTEIPLTNFRGIEMRDFSAEIARLALIIAEYQADVVHIGQKEARQAFLPLDAQNWITCGNALRLDWLSICPPTGSSVKLKSDDLFGSLLDQAEIDFENEGGETYVCGNPPYIGTKYQTKTHKEEIAHAFTGEGIKSGNLDYISCWFLYAARFMAYQTDGSFSFVSTTSLFQGEQAEAVLHIITRYNLCIAWCHSDFPWSNNAANNAGVICCIVGLADRESVGIRAIYEDETKRIVKNIGPYLVPMPDTVVTKRGAPLSDVSSMGYGSMSNDGGHFDVPPSEYDQFVNDDSQVEQFVKRTYGGAEFIRGLVRRSIYIHEGEELSEAQAKALAAKFQNVQDYRLSSKREATRKLAKAPKHFAEMRHIEKRKIFVPQVLSGRREYVTCGLLPEDALVIAPHMQIVDGGLFEFALLSSKLHQVWIETVCGKLKSDIRYSNLLGWNTFPVPPLTEKNRHDLTLSAARILVAREENFPATIGEMYQREQMPEGLRAAHEANDEILERVWIGRVFKNDTERLEKLLSLYERMSREKS